MGLFRTLSEALLLLMVILGWVLVLHNLCGALGPTRGWYCRIVIINYHT